MKHKYYCKKCGIVVELDEYDPQFGELKKVFCSNCRGGVRMWQVIPTEKHLFVEDDVRANNDIKTKMKGGNKQNDKFKRNSKRI